MNYIGSERERERDVMLGVHMLADGHFWCLWMWAKRVLKNISWRHTFNEISMTLSLSLYIRTRPFSQISSFYTRNVCWLVTKTSLFRAKKICIAGYVYGKLFCNCWTLFQNATVSVFVFLTNHSLQLVFNVLPNHLSVVPYARLTRMSASPHPPPYPFISPVSLTQPTLPATD